MSFDAFVLGCAKGDKETAMAFFPKIQSPCPYIADLGAIMDGDFCRMCERQVFDLSHMSSNEKKAFLDGCTGEVCISYRFTPALAAAALAAAMPSAAAAQDLGPVVPDAAAIAASTAEIAAMEGEAIIVTGGGIKDPRNVQYVEDPTAPDAPALPVVYDDPPARQAAAAPALPATGG
jgi:predicted Fe-S protein YdhL (DUF1289 family)